MSLDYKRYAINAYLTEKFCIGPENPKYSTKYRELTERALYGDKNWHKLKDQLCEKLDENLKSLGSVPYSIRKAATEIHDHFKIPA